jgi:hypothetical protein
MRASSPSDSGVDRLLDELPEELRAIAGALRRLVQKHAPELEECVKWNNPFWVGKKSVACLMLYPDHINLGFFRGAQLSRKYGELEGTGKGLRHVKIRTLREVRNPTLPHLIRDAVRLDETAT